MYTIELNHGYLSQINITPEDIELKITLSPLAAIDFKDETSRNAMIHFLELNKPNELFIASEI